MFCRFKESFLSYQLIIFKKESRSHTFFPKFRFENANFSRHFLINSNYEPTHGVPEGGQKQKKKMPGYDTYIF